MQPDTLDTTGQPTAESAGKFRLVALAPDGAVGRWRDLGSYPDLDTALVARVEDVLAQLTRNDGWLITCEHLVISPGIGPGHDERAHVASHVTQLGADPTSDRIPEPHNEPELRRWLLAASGLDQAPR